MTKYRFKTEQEFIDEFGDKWKSKVCWNGYGRMDYLFGIEIQGYNEDYFNTDICDFMLKNTSNGYVSYWCISNDMVKQTQLINYNEKKVLVYD